LGWEEFYLSRYHIAQCQLMLSLNNAAISTLMALEKDAACVSRASHLFLLGVVLFEERRYVEAAERFQKCRDLQVPLANQPVYPEHYGENAVPWLAKSLAAAGLNEKLAKLPPVLENAHLAPTIVFEAEAGSNWPQDRLRRENIAKAMQKIWPEAEVFLELDLEKACAMADILICTRYLVDGQAVERLVEFAHGTGILCVDACESIFDMVSESALNGSKRIVKEADLVVTCSRGLAERIESIYGVPAYVIGDTHEADS